MKFDFSLLKKCAFAVTLLSLSQVQGFADVDEEAHVLNHLEKKIVMDVGREDLLADSMLDADEIDDLFFDDSSEALMAKHNKKRRKKGRKHSSNKAFSDEANPPIAAVQDGNNTWIPRFVWIGDVENSDNLKCFAAFLIGSLSEHSQMGAPMEGQKFTPGFFTTPNDKNAQAKLSTSLDQDYIAQRPNPKHKARQKDQKQKGRAKKGCPRARVYLDLHAGPNFLFFTEYKGNLMPRPAGVFPAQTGSPTGLTIIKGRPKYNVTPLLEMDATLNFLKWLGVSAYLQSSQGAYITTDSYSFASQTASFGGGLITGRFQSAVDFYAVGGKLLFSFPNVVRFKTWSIGLFAAGGVGGGFQSWKNSIGYQTYTPGNILNGAAVDNNLVFNTTNLSNFTYTVDAAISFKTRSPFPMTLLKFGCKFIGWGPVRNIGKSRTPHYSYEYIEPIQMGGIFSIVPYMGFTWSF